jgi:hypothetical protein
MSRHAYLIVAHDNFYVLEKLVQLIDDPRNAIYVHIDGKVVDFDEEALARLCRHSPVTFIPRIKVYWGDYSLLEVSFRLLERAAADGHDYYHLLSAADLPLQTQDDIHDFCARHAGTEFVGFADGFDPTWVSEIHVLRRHLRSRHRLLRTARALVARGFARLQRWGGYDRTRRFGLELRKGSDWYSITDALVRHLLDNEATAKALLKHALSASEFAVQTLVWNSAFRQRVHDPGDEYASNMRLIDWTRGDPYVFRRGDLQELLASGRWFARKFQVAVDKEVIDRLCAHLAARQGTVFARGPEVDAPPAARDGTIQAAN